jgi:LuxR family maltose regulon positive regulatory protein
MPIPILRTKLYIPPVRSELVSRPRLVGRLDEGLRRGHKLTLVSAPAGFGKTTLLSEWIQSSETPSPQFAWLSLDKNDNEPTRFWAYVLTALRTISSLCEAGVGESALGMIQSPQPPPIEALLTDLINDVAEMALSGHSLVLVLDDFHVIANPQVDEALTFLLDNLPPPMHLVVATRSDPSLPLSRLRGRAWLTELSAADLRFTPEEAAAFLNQVMGLGLSTEDVDALDTRTEGWIVGLQMAAHALQRTLAAQGGKTSQLHEFVAAFAGSHRYALDYLTDEVLLREPEHIQAFLLQTSVLERLSGPLCDALTGLDGGQEMLEQLEATNLFIVPLDGERQWYRYHHLFAELLGKRLHRMHADLVPALHQRASEWYEGANLIEEAITHALAGRDYERVARLVEQYAAQQMSTYRQEAALAEWLAALPDELVRERPWLCVYLGWTRYWMGMRSQVEECLLCAEEALARSADAAQGTDERLISGYIAAIRAHHALTNQALQRVIEMAERAQRFLPEGDYMRCEAAVALGGAYWGLGNVVASARAFAQARATALKSGYRPLAVPASCYLSDQQVKQGQLHEASATCREALEWAIGPSGRALPVAGFPLVKLGGLAREWNDLATAGRDLGKGIDLCLQLGQADVQAEGYVALARLKLAQHDLDGALDNLQKADEIAQNVQIDPWITCWADECRLQLWLSTGNLAAAAQWAQASGLGVDGDLSYQYDLHHINLARALIAQGAADGRDVALDQALGLLARLLAAAEEAGWVHQQIKVLVLQAVALEARGDGVGALDALDRALALAEPGGYVRVFVDEGTPMAHLLSQVAEQDTAPHRPYVDRLLAAFEMPLQEVPAQTAPPSTVDGPPSILIEPLSERERQVLQLIADGMANREIAETLFISLGTVKAHTSNIYGKLGVRSRTQAVAKARELGIL